MEVKITYKYHPSRHDILIKEKSFGSHFYIQYEQEQYKSRNKIVAWISVDTSGYYWLTLRIGRTLNGKDIIKYKRYSKEKCYKILNKFLSELKPCT